MPCVIKTASGGSSLGVFLPEDRAALAEALEQVRGYDGGILWEERIYGRELTVGVLGDRALPPVEILPAEGEFDYAAKYQAGGNLPRAGDGGPETGNGRAGLKAPPHPGSGGLFPDRLHHGRSGKILVPGNQ